MTNQAKPKLKPLDIIEPSEFIYPPSRATKVALSEFERRIKNQSVLTWNIPEMDARVVPAIPGDLITIMGRPGMGKTMTLLYLCRHFDRIAQEMNANNPGTTHVVVYASFETTVEEFIGIISGPVSNYTLEDIGRGNADLDIIRNSLLMTLGSSLVVFGQSAENRDSPHPPDLLDLHLALKWLRETYGWVVIALLIDHLQAAPPLPQHRNVHDDQYTVSQNLKACKDIAKGERVPTFLAVQAKREVDAYTGLKFPRMSDAQWTSATEQFSDKIFTETMPSKYTELGQEITLSGWRYTVQDNTLGIRMIKQRFGSADMSDVWMLQVDYDNLSLALQEPVGAVEEEAAF